MSEAGAPVTGTIAFLGLGHMGGPMAVNLVKAGYRVRLRRGAGGPGRRRGARLPPPGRQPKRRRAPPSC